jgi:hypothetical protein
MGHQVGLFQNVSWGLTAFLQAVLLAFVLWRKLYRTHPAFLFYILAALLENAIIFFAYSVWDSTSFRVWTIAWSSQAAVIGARWFAVAEIARKVLADYSGIRGLATRILFVLGICVLVYAGASSLKKWTDVLLYADRAVELCIAVFIVVLLAFARYYRLPVSNLHSQLAIGFCLYSCAFVINLTILERWPHIFGGFWNYLSALAYFGSILLWIQAVRKPAEAPEAVAPATISPEAYGALSQQLNSRVNVLNSRLSHLFRSEDNRS